MTKRRPHRHDREESTRRFGDQDNTSGWTTRESRPFETADDLPDPVSVSSGRGTTAGGASDQLGGATTGVGSTFGTTRKGTDISRGDDVEGDPE